MTCSAVGEKQRDCDRCDHFETQDVAALGLSVPVVKVTRYYTTGGATLSWDAVSDADAYNIYRDTGTGVFTKLDVVYDATSCRVAIPVAETYTFRVEVVYTTDETLNSMSADVDIVGKCARPKVTVSNKESTGKPVLTWPAVDGAAKYYIYRSSEGEEEVRIGSTTKLTYTDTKAETGKTYSYRIKAIAATSGYASQLSKPVTGIRVNP